MARQNAQSLMRKYLGKETADVLLKKVDKMAKEGATAAAIEKVISADLVNHIEGQVASAVIAKIGPITPIKVKPISVDIKAKITPITISPKITSGVQVRVGPGIVAKGSK